MEWARQAAARKHGVELPADMIASLREGAALTGLELDNYLRKPTTGQEQA